MKFHAISDIHVCTLLCLEYKHIKSRERILFDFRRCGFSIQTRALNAQGKTVTGKVIKLLSAAHFIHENFVIVRDLKAFES